MRSVLAHRCSAAYTSRVGERLRRLLHLVVVLTTAAVLAAPLLLGPGAGAIVRALGSADVHRCACGMRAGACGCPECERLERTRAHDAEALRGHPILKTTCDGEGAAGGYAPLPSFAAPIAATLPPLPSELRGFAAAPELEPSLERARPPTPPPRHASV